MQFIVKTEVLEDRKYTIKNAEKYLTRFERHQLRKSLMRGIYSMDCELYTGQNGEVYIKGVVYRKIILRRIVLDTPFGKTIANAVEDVLVDEYGFVIYHRPIIGIRKKIVDCPLNEFSTCEISKTILVDPNKT